MYTYIKVEMFCQEEWSRDEQSGSAPYTISSPLRNRTSSRNILLSQAAGGGDLKGLSRRETHMADYEFAMNDCMYLIDSSVRDLSVLRFRVEWVSTAISGAYKQ